MPFVVIPTLDADLEVLGLRKRGSKQTAQPTNTHSLFESQEAQASPEVQEPAAATGQIDESQIDDLIAAVEESIEEDTVLDEIDGLIEEVEAELASLLDEADESDFDTDLAEDADFDLDEDEDLPDLADLQEMYGPERDGIPLDPPKTKSPMVPDEYLKLYVEAIERGDVIAESFSREERRQIFEMCEDIAEVFDEIGRGDEVREIAMLNPTEMIEAYVEAGQLIESEDDEIVSVQRALIEEILNEGLFKKVKKKIVSLATKLKRRLTGKKYRKTAGARKSARKRGLFLKTGRGKRMEKKRRKTRSKMSVSARKRTRLVQAQVEQLEARSEDLDALNDAKAALSESEADQLAEAIKGFEAVGDAASKLHEALSLYAGHYEDEQLFELSESFEAIATEALDIAEAVAEGQVTYAEAKETYNEYLKAVYSGADVYADLKEETDEDSLKKYLGLNDDDAGNVPPSKAFETMGKEAEAENVKAQPKDKSRPFNEGKAKDDEEDDDEDMPEKKGLGEMKSCGGKKKGKDDEKESDDEDMEEDMSIEEMTELLGAARGLYEAYESKSVSEMGVSEMTKMLDEMGYEPSEMKSMSEGEMREACKGYMEALGEMFGEGK